MKKRVSPLPANLHTVLAIDDDLVCPNMQRPLGDSQCVIFSLETSPFGC